MNIIQYILLLASASLLVGCTVGNATETAVDAVYVTATPDSAAVAQVVPATPTPLPALAPEVQVQIAQSLLDKGYFEDAVAGFRVVAEADGFAPDLRAAAALQMAQAALREGLFQDAEDAATLLINTFPNDGRAGQVLFLRGDARLGLSRWQDAIADFEQYMAARPGLLDSYAHERIGDAYLALGETDRALASYDQAFATERTTLSYVIFREKVAQILKQIGRTQDAIAQYDAILAVARNAPYRASIELLAARAFQEAGDIQNANARLQRVYTTYADTASAYDAVQALIANGVAIDGFSRGRIAYNAGRYDEAVTAFNDFSSSTTLDGIPAELYLLLGRAYREIGNPGAALVAFQTIIDSYATDPLFGDALLERGRTAFLGDDIPMAIDTYLAIASDYAYLPAAAEALWRAGYLYATNDDPAQARATFTRLADAYPDSEWATNGLFIAASSAVNEGLDSVAENLYSRLAVLSAGVDQAAAYLGVGRLAAARGDQAAAQEAFRLATIAAPDSYAAARAADLLQGRAPFEPAPALQFAFDEAQALAEAEAWLRERLAITEPGALWPLSGALASDQRLVRGNELWTAAAYSEARAEFDLVLDELREQGDALSSYQMAVFLRGLGAYQSSIVAAADVLNALGAATLDAPSLIARMRYPVYYLDLVQEVADQYDFDPLTLFALIRAESLFNTNATAAAGEKGLTQVIPSTAEYIAGELGWPDYQHSNLFRPYAGIAFGAFYLGEQLALFDGNTIAALAAYNAGPGRALDWQKLSGGDPDQFMTSMTIASTRTYVERIYSFHSIYRSLYGADG
jgi:soluble lytic murein transglycosylase